jgi:uncharacterized protein YbjT (DUF2867 family)
MFILLSRGGITRSEPITAATSSALFDRADKLFLLTPGIGMDHTAHAVAAAQAAGVGHIVHLSSFSVLGDPMPAMGHWHHQREELVRASAIPATFLRPVGFMSNAFDWVPTIREGYAINPIGLGRYASIDPADIAAVAALVLTEDGHEGQCYVPTGDELLTVADHVQILAAAIGREIEVRDAATLAEAVQARFPNGAPPALAVAITEGYALMRADTVGFRTDTVERLLGRRPTTFADWCARNADTFRRLTAA